MAFDDRGKERRISLILLQYWNALRGDRPYPREDEVDPDQLRMIWEHCFTVHYRADVGGYIYTYLGPEITRPYAQGVLDMANNVMIAPDPARCAHSFHHVLETGDPLLDEGECLSLDGQIVRFRQCMMPLGTEDGQMRGIIGGAWYKIFSE